MTAALLGVAILITSYLAIKSPFKGLLALLAINVVQPGELYPIFESLHIERAVVIIVLCSTLLRQDETIKIPPLSKKLIFFWVMIAVGIPFAFWRGGSASAALDFGKTIVYNLLIVSLVNTRERFRQFLTVYAAAIGYLGASSAWGYFHGDSVFAQGIDRAQGLTNAGGDPNSLAITLVTALPLTLLLVAERGKLLRGFAIAICAVNICTIVLTGSRTGFLCLLMLAMVFVVTRKRAVARLPLLAIAVAAVWVAMPAEYKGRYTSVEHLKNDESYQNRIISWKSGLHMFEDHPLTGVGIGNFPDANGEKYWPIKNGVRIWLQPHSLYVQAIAETGLLGTSAFLLLLISMVRDNRKLRRMLREGEAPGWIKNFPLAANFSILGLLICGYSAHLLYRHTWYELAAMTSAMGMIAASEQLATTEPRGAKTLGVSSGYVIGRPVLPVEVGR